MGFLTKFLKDKKNTTELDEVERKKKEELAIAKEKFNQKLDSWRDLYISLFSQEFLLTDARELLDGSYYTFDDIENIINKDAEVFCKEFKKNEQYKNAFNTKLYSNGGLDEFFKNNPSDLKEAIEVFKSKLCIEGSTEINVTFKEEMMYFEKRIKKFISLETIMQKQKRTLPTIKGVLDEEKEQEKKENMAELKANLNILFKEKFLDRKEFRGLIGTTTELKNLKEELETYIEKKITTAINYTDSEVKKLKTTIEITIEKIETTMEKVDENAKRIEILQDDTTT